MFDSPIAVKFALMLNLVLSTIAVAQDTPEAGHSKEFVEGRIQQYWLDRVDAKEIPESLRKSPFEPGKPFVVSTRPKSGVREPAPKTLPAFETRWTKEFRSLLNESEDSEITETIQLQLGIIYWNNRQWEDCAALYLKCIERDRTHRFVEKFTRQIHVVLLASNEKVQSQVLTAIARASKSNENDASRFLYALGYWSELEKEIEKAKANYEELLRRFPEGRYAGIARNRLKGITELHVGKPAPGFETKDIDGNAISLSALRGKVVVLHFWATWCGPCKPHLPHLEELFSTCDKDQFALLSISIDHDEKAYSDFVKQMRSENKFAWTQICDFKVYAGDVTKEFSLSGVPATYVIDQQGNIVAKNLHGEELNQRVRREIDPTIEAPAVSPATLTTFVRCVDEGSIEFHVNRVKDKTAAERFRVLFEAIGNARPPVARIKQEIPKAGARTMQIVRAKTPSEAKELTAEESFKLINRCIDDGTFKVKFNRPDGPEQQQRLDKVVAALIDASKTVDEKQGR